MLGPARGIEEYTMNQSPLTAPIFNFVALNPRKGPEQMSAEQWRSTLGIEVTRRDLAAACSLGNIDPQHGMHVAMANWPASTRGPVAACTYAADVPVPPDGSTIAFLKPDVDSVLAAAVLVLRRVMGFAVPYLGHERPLEGTGINQRDIDVTRRLELVAKRDGFTPGAMWTARPLPTTASLWPTTAAPVEETESLAPLGVICSPAPGQPQMPLGDRVAVVACWLLWGMPDGVMPGPDVISIVHGWTSVSAPDQALIAEAIYAACSTPTTALPPSNAAAVALLRAAQTATKARLATARDVESGEAAPRLVNGIAVVDYSNRGALGLGYCLSPVVIATGLPAGVAARKFTIAAWSPRYADFPAMLAALNSTEASERAVLGASGRYHEASENACAREVAADGWGGNLASGIIGSPQGAGSFLATEDVIAIVARHVCPRCAS